MDQLIVGVDKKVEIWIPGRLLYGGYIKYKENFVFLFGMVFIGNPRSETNMGG